MYINKSEFFQFNSSIISIVKSIIFGGKKRLGKEFAKKKSCPSYCPKSHFPEFIVIRFLEKMEKELGTKVFKETAKLQFSKRVVIFSLFYKNLFLNYFYFQKIAFTTSLLFLAKTNHHSGTFVSPEFFNNLTNYHSKK